MKGGYKAMRASVETSPLALAYMDDKLKSIANNMLPFTVGFEFESVPNDKYTYYDISCKLTKLTADGYFDGYVASDESEYRFTLARGIKGMVGLYYALEIFKECLVLNKSRGIHIHVYVPKKYRSHVTRHLYASINSKSNYVLNVLDSFKYDGKYNSRRVSESGASWVRGNNNDKTIEYRIFAMTFDYSKLIKIVMKLIALNKLIFKASMLNENDSHRSEMHFLTKNKVEKTLLNQEARAKAQRKERIEGAIARKEKIKKFVKKKLESKQPKIVGKVILNSASNSMTRIAIRTETGNSEYGFS